MARAAKMAETRWCMLSVLWLCARAPARVGRSRGAAARVGAEPRGGRRVRPRGGRRQGGRRGMGRDVSS